MSLEDSPYDVCQMGNGPTLLRHAVSTFNKTFIWLYEATKNTHFEHEVRLVSQEMEAVFLETNFFLYFYINEQRFPRSGYHPLIRGVLNQTTGLDRIPTSISRSNPTPISIWLVKLS